MIAFEKDIEEEVNVAWNERNRDLRSSFNLGLQILAKSELENYTLGLAGACKILGYCYWRFSDYSQSLNYSLRAIQLYKILGDKGGEADALNSLGAVYMFQHEHFKRLQCNLECLKIREAIGDLEAVAGSQNNIGETYLEMGDEENAIIWLNKALENKSSDATNISWANFNLGKIYLLKKEVDNAILFFNKSLEVSLLVNYEVLIAESYIELAKIYIDAQAVDKALTHILKAIELAKEIGNKEYLGEAYSILATIHEQEGKLKEALSVYKKYHEIHVALFNEKKAEEIKDINYQYELNRISKEAEIERTKSVELKVAYDKIELQNNVIEAKNREFIDSVTYAKQIQKAFLADRKVLDNQGFESFLIFKPKDIVSGDFYWSGQFNNFIYIVVGDCTGHGVPGGFLTMLGIAYLNELIALSSMHAPNEILTLLRAKIIKDVSGTSTYRDGMDISIVKINVNNNEVEWAGAKNPLWIIKKGSNLVEVIPGDKQSVCYNEELDPFVNHSFKLSKGDLIYLFTDGYCDQFGGDRNKKFGRKRFRNALLGYRDKAMVEQKSHLVYEYTNWKKDEEQIDDMCIVGIRF